MKRKVDFDSSEGDQVTIFPEEIHVVKAVSLGLVK